MSDIRLERIERLVAELEYEITRGVMEREINPDLSFEKLMPGGPTGEVALQLYVRPVRKGDHFAARRDFNLRVVSENKKARPE